MSLYGALFAGVAGLTAQARKLAVISDNVSNVNTVGYKGGGSTFETLVTSSAATAAYSPGGVIGGSRQLVSKQGLLQATDSATDIAISGGGFFVVNQNSAGDGSVFYTRSGSFRADSLGNYRNSSGFYLQAWPLDREGRLPGAAGNTTHTQSSSNLGSLEVVNIGNLGGSAAATTSVSVGANLNAAQTIFPGISGTITMDSLSANNATVKAKDIIIPGGLNGVSRGDKLDITTGNGLSFTYRYGGFTHGRSVADASGADSGVALLAGTTTLGGNPFSFTPGSNVVTVTQPAHGLVDGAVVTLSGNTTTMAGIPSAEFNANFVVDVIDANHYTFRTSTSAAAAADITDNSAVTTSGANASVTVDLGAAGLYSVGQNITIAGATTMNGINLNGTHTITAVSGTTVTWATTTTTPPALAANAFSTTSGANATVTVNVGATNNYSVGQTITIAGAVGINGIPAGTINGAHTITAVSGSNVSFATTVTTPPAVVANSFTTTLGANSSVTVDVGATNTYAVGQSITIAGAVGMNGVAAGTINGTHTITAVSGTTVTFATTTTTALNNLGDQAFSTTDTGLNPTFTVDTTGSGNTYVAGQTITIAGAGLVNGVNLNGTWTVTSVSGANVTFDAIGQTAAAASLGASPFTFPASTLNPTVVMDVGTGNGANYQVGDSITIVSPNDPVNGLTLAGTYTVTVVSGDNVSFTASGTNTTSGAFGGAGATVYQNTGGGASVTEFKATGGGSVATNFAAVGGGASATNFAAVGGGTVGTATFAAGGGAAVSSITRPFSGYILDATNSETRFLGVTGTSGFTTDGLTFKITTAAVGTVTFSYTSASPDVRQKQFNNLSNLASAINEVTGLSARVVDGQLYVGATDANAAVTFENGSTLGTEGPVRAGIDWVRELGLQNITAGTGRFSTLQGLYNLATADPGISASLSNPLGDAQLKINVDDPLDTIHFSDSATQSSLTAFTSTTPFTTTSGSKTVTVTHPSAHGFATGDFVTLNAATLASTTTLATANPVTSTIGANPTVTLDITGAGQTYTAGQLITVAGATNVNGANLNGTWTVVSASATTVTFVATGRTTSGVAAAGGGAAVTASYGSFNGIPIADFSGRYEITVTGATTYTLQLPDAATATGATGAAGLVITPHNNLGSLVAELGLVTSLNGTAYSSAGPQATSDLGPSYSPTDTALNMASGHVVAQFSRPIRIYDAQGAGHDLNMAFLKTSPNTWAVEVYAVPASDVSSPLPDGLVAYGNVSFNGDGTLSNIDTTLTDAVDIAWTNAASPSSVSFNWGTQGQQFGTVGATVFGEADGLSQFSAAYKVSFANQNGAPVGELTSVSITELGVIVASYSNGQTQNLYKIPIAAFANPDQLTSNSGNVFAQSADSGEFNLQQAGTSGVGKIASSSLEASNVELSQELTDMIVAQRSYQANAKVISTSDSMLNVLNDIIR